jgi:hypothetical protein
LMAELPGALAAITATDARGAGRDSVREAAGLMAALGQAAQQKAAPTATAAIQLSSQLEKFFAAGTADLDEKIGKLQDRAKKIAVGGVKGPQEKAAMADVKSQIASLQAEKAAAAVADPGTLAGRIEAVQRSQALQDRLLPDLTGEAKFLPAMRQLLEGRDSEVTTQFRKNTAAPEQGGMTVGPQQFDILAGELGGQSQVSGAVRQQAAQAQTRAETEALALQNDAAAAMAQIRDKFDAAMKASGTGVGMILEKNLKQTEFGALQGDTPESAARKADQLLAEQEQAIRNGRTDIVSGAGRTASWGMSGGKLGRAAAKIKSEERQRPMEELTEDERMRVELIRRRRQEIRELGGLQMPVAGQPRVTPESAGAVRPTSPTGLTSPTGPTTPTGPTIPTAVPEPTLPPGADLDRRVADLVPRPSPAAPPLRSPEGQQIAQTAAAAVDVTPLVAAQQQQTAELQATRASVEKMGQSFDRAANRLAGVAARSDLRAAN